MPYQPFYPLCPLHHVVPWWADYTMLSHGERPWAALTLMHQCHCQCHWRNWAALSLEVCISEIQYNLQPWRPEAYLISVSHFCTWLKFLALWILSPLEFWKTVRSNWQSWGRPNNSPGRCKHRDSDDFSVKEVYVMVRRHLVQYLQ